MQVKTLIVDINIKHHFNSTAVASTSDTEYINICMSITYDLWCGDCFALFGMEIYGVKGGLIENF